MEIRRLSLFIQIFQAASIHISVLVFLALVLLLLGILVLSFGLYQFSSQLPDISRIRHCSQINIDNIAFMLHTFGFLLVGPIRIVSAAPAALLLNISLLLLFPSLVIFRIGRPVELLFDNVYEFFVTHYHANPLSQLL